MHEQSYEKIQTLKPRSRDNWHRSEIEYHQKHQFKANLKCIAQIYDELLTLLPGEVRTKLLARNSVNATVLHWRPNCRREIPNLPRNSSPDALISDVPSFRLAPDLSFIPPSNRSLSLPLSTPSFPVYWPIATWAELWFRISQGFRRPQWCVKAMESLEREGVRELEGNELRERGCVN